MNNSLFLDVLKASFIKYHETSSRSNEKLKILHSTVTKSIINSLNNKNGDFGDYNAYSLGFNNGKERKINGRYIQKQVDITITKNDEAIAGVAVKFVMCNYMQNSNNYFENMLGETANIRSNQIPYFQIFIIPDKVPYFDKYGNITKWENINSNNLKKYIVLSNDNVSEFLHTPNKTLMAIINISGDDPPQFNNKAGWAHYYTTQPFTVEFSSLKFDFGKNIIYNNYESFINKISHYILSA